MVVRITRLSIQIIIVRLHRASFYLEQGEQKREFYYTMILIVGEENALGPKC